MREKLLNNIGIKILSLILAALLWIVIITTEDPVISKKFTNVPVTVLNEEVLQSQDKVYEIVEGSTVDIVVYAKTSLFNNLTQSDFKVTADLSELTPPWDSVKIWVTCPKYDTMSNSKFRYSLGKTSVMRISLEDKVTKQFQVQVTTTGNIEEGYALGTKSARPNIIQVSGAESQIETIAEVRVNVDVTGQSEDIKVRVEPKAYDEKGRELDSSKLTFSSKQVTAQIQMLETKTVPIAVKTKGEASEGYVLTSVEYEPKQLEVKGTKEQLAKVDSIEIPININERSVGFEIQEEVSNLESRLPEGVKFTEDISTISIKVVINELATKDITIPISQIEIKNLSNDIQFTPTQGITGTVIVRVAGLKEKIDHIDFSTISAVIDVKGLREGVHTKTVEFVLPEEVHLVQAPELDFSLEKKETEEETNTTDTPESTKEPEESQEPEASEEPEVTEKPKETEQPVETEKPVAPTKKPVDPTKKPEVTEQPTQEPEVTQEPKPSENITEEPVENTEVEPEDSIIPS